VELELLWYNFDVKRKIMKIIIVFGIIGIIFYSAYFFLFKYPVNSTINNIFKQNSIQTKFLDCTSSISNRVGVCKGNFSQNEAGIIVNNLNLKEIKEEKFKTFRQLDYETVINLTNSKDKKEENQYLTITSQKTNISYACENNSKFTSLDTQVFISRNRYSDVYYLILYYNQKNGDACLQVQYAYG
jgi:hypothetical protein